MAIYYGDDNKIYNSGDFIARGGAGEIYDVQEMPDKVMKIFKERKKSRELKIEALRKLPWNYATRNYIVLPDIILYEDPAHTIFSGYIMQKIDTNYLLADAYSQEHPLSTRVKALVAKNLCKAVIAVHSNMNNNVKSNVFIGDFNSKNIAVNRINGDIKIIDCDSLHLQIDVGGKYRKFPCTELDQTLFMPEIIRLAKKNRKATFESLARNHTTFTAYTDYYCLAYHIHMLLLACTPFGCAVDKSVVQDSVVSINTPDSYTTAEQGLYTYTNLSSGTKIPESYPDFDVIPRDIQKLFIRAFVDGASNPSMRPTAYEFETAIINYIEELVYCECDKWDHYIYKDYYTMGHNDHCEWCRIEKVNETERKITGVDIALMPNEELLQFIKVAPNVDSKAYALFEYGRRLRGEAYVIQAGYITDMPKNKVEAKKYFKKALEIVQNPEIKKIIQQKI